MDKKRDRESLGPPVHPLKYLGLTSTGVKYLYYIESINMDNNMDAFRLTLINFLGNKDL